MYDPNAICEAFHVPASGPTARHVALRGHDGNHEAIVSGCGRPFELSQHDMPLTIAARIDDERVPWTLYRAIVEV